MGFSVSAAGGTNEGEHGDISSSSTTTTTMKPPPAIVASSSWPCANCHTTVSSERCPTCQGVQVRIARESLRTQAFLMERLSPALFGRTSTPLSFPEQQQQQQQHEGSSSEADYEFRPLDPVACILASAPSPIMNNEKQKLTLHSLKEIEDELKLRRNKRPVGVVAEGSATTASASLLPPKKTKWLSAV